MRLLLDTHAVIWALNDDERLGSAARTLLRDTENKAFVSMASFWEITIKVRAGKLATSLVGMMSEVSDAGFDVLGIEKHHLLALAELPAHHRDPFDNLLVAQAIAENATFLSDDSRIGLYPVRYLRCSGLRGSV